MQHRALRPPRSLALALQGGGSFGAFTWGVLDRVLEEDGIALAGVSGASAGSVNAVLMADGLVAGGREEARARLARFWKLLSDRSGPSLLAAFGAMLPVAEFPVSPFSLIMPGSDPLRDLLHDLVDFPRLRAEAPFPMLLAATRVRDGTARIFREDEVSLEVVLASACLPLLRPAVMIGEEAYWDGGFSANPPLMDLIEATPADDVLVVELTPQERNDHPRLHHDIHHRSLEIAFAGPLRRELATIRDLCALCRQYGPQRPGMCRRLGKLRLHRLSAFEAMPDIADHNAADLSWWFLSRLHAAGRDAAAAWLEDLRQPAPGWARRPEA